MSTIDIKIQKPAYGGYGLGFFNGKACFVPYAVPDDEHAGLKQFALADYKFLTMMQASEAIRSIF